MEQYQRLEMEVIAFDTEDVITTSNGNGKDIETEPTPTKVSIITGLPG